MEQSQHTVWAGIQYLVNTASGITLTCSGGEQKKKGESPFTSLFLAVNSNILIESEGHIDPLSSTDTNSETQFGTD